MANKDVDVLKQKLRNTQRAAMKDKIQAIVLITEDGNEHHFTGKASLLEDDVVIGIKVGKPIDMPKDTEWADFNDAWEE